MSEKKKIWICSIIIALLLIALGFLAWLFISNPNEEPVADQSQTSTLSGDEAAWSEMEIVCGDLEYEECRTDYEEYLTEISGRASVEENTDLAQQLLEISQIDPSGDVNTDIKEYLGWDESDISSPAEGFDQIWIKSFIGKDYAYAFLGIPGDEVNKTQQEEPGSVPITFISESGKVMDTQFFSYSIFGDNTIVPCMKDHCVY